MTEQDTKSEVCAFPGCECHADTSFVDDNDKSYCCEGCAAGRGCNFPECGCAQHG